MVAGVILLLFLVACCCNATAAIVGAGSTRLQPGIKENTRNTLTKHVPGNSDNIEHRQHEEPRGAEAGCVTGPPCKMMMYGTRNMLPLFLLRAHTCLLYTSDAADE